MRRHALESRADRGIRAYVTSSDDAREARLRALRPHATSCGELKARGTRAARRPRAARAACWRRSRGMARMKPATSTLFCGRRGTEVRCSIERCTAAFLVVKTSTTRHQQRANVRQYRWIELAPDVRPRGRRGASTSLRTLFASMTSSPLRMATVYSPIWAMRDAAMRVLRRRSESLPIILRGA